MGSPRLLGVGLAHGIERKPGDRAAARYRRGPYRWVTDPGRAVNGAPIALACSWGCVANRVSVFTLLDLPYNEFDLSST